MGSSKQRNRIDEHLGSSSRQKGRPVWLKYKKEGFDPWWCWGGQLWIDFAGHDEKFAHYAKNHGTSLNGFKRDGWVGRGWHDHQILGPYN